MESRTSYAVVSLIALVALSCGSSVPDKAVGNIASSAPANSEASSTSAEAAATTTSMSTTEDTIRDTVALDAEPATSA